MLMEVGGQGKLGSPRSGAPMWASSSGRKLTREFPGVCSKGGGGDWPAWLGQGAGDPSPSAPSSRVPGGSVGGTGVPVGGSAAVLGGGGPRDPRRDSRGERSPWLPPETSPDSPGEPGMQPRDPCLPWMLNGRGKNESFRSGDWRRDLGHWANERAGHEAKKAGNAPERHKWR